MLTEAATPEILTDPRVGPGWLRLLRAVRAAFDISKVVLAALGLILLQTGWGVLDRLFPESPAVGQIPCPARRCITRARGELDSSSWEFVRSTGWRLTEPARILATPLIALFALNKGSGWILARDACGSLGGGRGGYRWCAIAGLRCSRYHGCRDLELSARFDSRFVSPYR